MTPRRARPLLSLVVLFVLPMILGAAVAPQAYRFLAWLSQHVNLGPHFTDPPFKRVLSRSVLVFVLILLYPAIRMSGITSFRQLGWAENPRRWRVIGLWFAVGMISMGALYIVSDLAGALYFRPRSTDIVRMIVKWTSMLVGALFIGVFEETFFRGYIFGVFRQRLRFWGGAIAASVLFAVLHLARPAAPEWLDPTRWAAGFRMLPHITDGVQAQYFWPTVINLFLMGILLCMLYDQFGNIYAAIGLHAGWVWAMGIGTYMFDRSETLRLWALFGNSETISMTWLGAIVILGFIGAAFRMRRAGAGTGEGARPTST